MASWLPTSITVREASELVQVNVAEAEDVPGSA